MIKTITAAYYFCIFLCVFTGGVPGNACAQQGMPPVVPAAKTPSGAYDHGTETARAEAHFPGAFLAGIAVGASMPFAGGATAVLTYQAAGKSEHVGLADGIAGASLWTWGGAKLARHRGIDVQNPFVQNMSDRNGRNFGQDILKQPRRNGMPGTSWASFSE